MSAVKFHTCVLLLGSTLIFCLHCMYCTVVEPLGVNGTLKVLLIQPRSHLSSSSASLNSTAGFPQAPLASATPVLSKLTPATDFQTPTLVSIGQSQKIVASLGHTNNGGLLFSTLIVDHVSLKLSCCGFGLASVANTQHPIHPSLLPSSHTLICTSCNPNACPAGISTQQNFTNLPPSLSKKLCNLVASALVILANDVVHVDPAPTVPV